MRPSRVFRLIFRIFILILTLSVTIVSLLGGISAVLILQDFDENVNINIDDADFDLDINTTSGQVNNIAFTLPFNITNAGYFDLEKLRLSLQIAINYSHIDYPSPGLNETRKVIIYDNFQIFGNIPRGQTRNDAFSGDFSDFLSDNFPDLDTEVDFYSEPPIMSFYANLTISLDYSIGLHSLRFGVKDLHIGDYSGDG